MSDEREKKTWTPQQIPEDVAGSPPRTDKEPAAEPPEPADDSSGKNE